MKTALSQIYLIFLMAVSLSLIGLFPNGTCAGENNDSLPHHHLSLFAGVGTETNRNKSNETGFAIALEYELKFHHRLGIGALIEGLGHDTIRDILLAIPLSVHLTKHLRVFAGPGIEFTDEKDKFLFRLGLGYEFPIKKHWSLAPELFTDFIEGGAVTWALGVAVGYEF